jgi:hypothetical protein
LKPTIRISPIKGDPTLPPLASSGFFRGVRAALYIFANIFVNEFSRSVIFEDKY